MSFNFKPLEDLSKKVTELSGSHEIPVIELFTDSFISKNTNFENTQAFFDNSGFDFTDIESIPESELDTFIDKNSKFESWQQMLQIAGKEYFIKKLEL